MTPEQQIVQGATGLLALAVTAGVAYVSRYVKQHFHSQAISSAVSGLGTIAQATVADFNQRLVNQAKTENVWTPEYAASIKQDAIDAVKAQGSPLLKVATKSASAADALVSSLIEQQVVAAKAPTS